MNRGFLILEMMIAMAVMLMAISAVALVSFGSQEFLAGAQTNREALSLAQGLLEQEQALARKDFRLVNSVATSSAGGGQYHEWVSVGPSANGNDYVTKEVRAYVSWNENNTPHTVGLSTLVTNFESAAGSDTCASNLAGNWSSPSVYTFALSSLLNDTSVAYPVTGLDAYEGTLYVTVSNTSANTNTFFIFTISDPTHPALLGKLDNDAAHNTGLSAVAVAHSGTATYAYVASASSFSKGQLQILDVSNPSSPRVLTTYKLPTSVVPAAGLGKSIFYKDGYVYLGLAKASGGAEFHIIDVHNPQNPLVLGSYAVGHDINALYIKDTNAYVLHPTDASQKQQLTVLDVSDPKSPTAVGGAYYYMSDSNANGRSIYVVGDTLYLGTTVSASKPEWYALSNADHAQLAALPPLAQKEMGSSVVGLIVRDFLAFLLTTKQGAQPGQLQIINATSTQPVFAVSLGGGVTAGGVALDCEGNYLYAASVDSANNGYLTVVTGS